MKRVANGKKLCKFTPNFEDKQTDEEILCCNFFMNCRLSAEKHRYFSLIWTKEMNLFSDHRIKMKSNIRAYSFIFIIKIRCLAFLSHYYSCAFENFLDRERKKTLLSAINIFDRFIIIFLERFCYPSLSSPSNYDDIYNQIKFLMQLISRCRLLSSHWKLFQKLSRLFTKHSNRCLPYIQRRKRKFTPRLCKTLCAYVLLITFILVVLWHCFHCVMTTIYPFINSL